MDDLTEHLAGLHTSAIDARNGYREALKEAEGRGLSPLFSELASLHDRHAAELSHLLTELGEAPDHEGSFMSLVHKTIMDVRSLFGGLDESVIPGLIDGEERNVAKYDDAIEELGENVAPETLGRHRAELSTVIGKLRAMNTAN